MRANVDRRTDGCARCRAASTKLSRTWPCVPCMLEGGGNRRNTCAFGLATVELPQGYSRANVYGVP